MKILLLSLISVLLTTFVHGQWMTTNYMLKGGWNAIYLHGDASYDTIENVISQSQVLEIWRWNTSPNQVTFTDSPSKPSAGAIEWSVWKRGLPDESTLTRLTGQCGYLVKCSGNSGNTYGFDLKHSPTLPENSWVRNGANLLGFPTPTTSSNATFTKYFETFPLAIESSAKIYKYAGGNLSSTSPRNPDAILSTAYGTEIVDRTKAYWFSAEVTSDFYAPIEIGLSNSKRVDFGSSGNTVTLRLRNRTSGNVTVTLTPTASQAAPLSATPVAGSVSLTRKTFNPDTAEWTSTALGSSISELILPSSTVEIVLGIDRGAMTGSPGALFASLLRVTDSTNLMDVYLPVTARKTSLAGLWVGDIQLNSVSNKVSNPGRATATIADGAVTGLTVVGSGGFGYVTPPTVTITPPAGNDMILATATAGINSANRTVTSLTLGGEGFGYNTPPTVTLSAPTASVSASYTASLSSNGTVSSFTPVNVGLGYRTAPTVTISAPPSSSNATANATMNGKSLHSISVTSGGGFYLERPTVTIDPPAARTTANATISGNAGNWTITKGVNGSGYSSVPAVTISGGNGTGGNATATLGLTADSFTINSGDKIYTTAPNVVITGGNATGGNATVGATANATLSSSGLVTGITISNMGEGYSTRPDLIFQGGNSTSGTVTPTAVGNANQFAVSTLSKTANGNYTGTLPTVTIAAPPAPIQATATAVLTNGTVSSINLTNNGTGYLSTPNVSMTGTSNATAEAIMSGKSLSGVTVTHGGGFYLATPTVTISAPATRTTANATISGNAGNWTITKGVNGSGYSSVPTVTILGGNGTGGNATATLGLTADSFTINSGNKTYTTAPTVVISGGNATVGANATATLSSGTSGLVTGITIVTMGEGYTTTPSLNFQGGNSTSGTVGPTAVGNADYFAVSTLTKVSNGNYTLTPDTVTITAPPAPVQATATAVLTNGTVSAINLTNNGTGYLSRPSITLTAPPSSSNATANATMNEKSLSGVTVTNGGGYYSITPTVTIGAPAARVNATATISGNASNWSITKGENGSGYSTVPTVLISGGNGTGGNATATLGLTADSFTITSGNKSYTTAPTVVITGGNATGGNATVGATANATLSSGLVTGITIINMGQGYSTRPNLTFEGGNSTSGTVGPTAVGNANQFAVSTITKTANGTYSLAPTTVSITPPPAPIQAIATAVLTNGAVSAINLTNNGTGYLSRPTVTIGGTIHSLPPFVTPVTATANATLNSGFTVASVTRNATGAGYLSPPTVTISAPPFAIQALATATVSNNRVAGFTITNEGYGYDSAPTVTLGEPTMSGQGARATANLTNGSITGFNIHHPGSGYTVVPAVTISAPPALTGTGTQSAFKLRTLLHVTPTGTAKLLSKAYLGALAVAPNSEGISTSEALLQTSSLGMARRFTSAHLPTGRVISANGTVALGNSLACTISLPYEDPSNPFVHQFHPDHDNKDTRFEPAPEGYESYDISRVGTFTFTTTPPNGADVPGWGSSVIGGTYREIVTGLHSSAIQLDGTFELRRTSEIGTLSE